MLLTSADLLSQAPWVNYGGIRDVPCGDRGGTERSVLGLAFSLDPVQS